MIKVRKIQEGDLEYAIEHAIEKELKMVDFRYDLIDGYTALVDDKIIMVGGIMPIWEGVGEAWAFITEDAKNNLIKSYRCVRDMFNKLIEEKQWRRVTASCLSDFRQGQNMLEHLGFVYEGCLRQHSQEGIDMYIYGKLI